MSSILKALKKLENERHKPPVGQSPLSREIFEGMSRAEVSSRSRSPLLLVLIALLLAGSGLAVWLVRQNLPAEQRIVEHVQTPVPMPSGSKRSLPRFFSPLEPIKAPKPPVVPLSHELAESFPSVPPKESSAPVPEALPPAVVKSSVPQLRTKEPVAKAVTTAKAPVVEPPQEAVSSVGKSSVRNAPLATPVVKAKPARPVVRQLPFPTPVRTTSAPVAIASRTPGWILPGAEKALPPELRVSEIHYKPAAQDRLAVVNDLPVLEGVDIDGARVDRIFKDRIRFVCNGRYLEVKVAAPQP